MAAALIERNAGPFLPAPRPYPEPSAYGWQWLTQQRYWIAFARTADGYVITAVFFETANIPDRI